MKINILGTEYEIIIKKYDEEESFERRGICGFCAGYTKEIVVCDMSTYPGWEHEDEKTIDIAQKLYTRHEIIHAFFFESGLAQNSTETDAWAGNEEMVDWIALQFPKMLKAMAAAQAI